MSTNSRSAREIRHGRYLAGKNPEMIWGWATVAGKIRAQRRARLIAEKVKLDKNCNVLEIGCGSGLFTSFFAQSRAHITAVDISADLLAIAQQKEFINNNVTFLQTDFRELELNDSFDVIIGSSILHHLAIEETLKKIFYLLKSNGIMCFAEPNMLNPQIFLQKNIPWLKEKLGDSPDETAFVRWVLSSWLGKVGYRKIDIIPFDWLHPATPATFIPLVERVGALIERLPLIKEFAGSLLISARKP